MTRMTTQDLHLAGFASYSYLEDGSLPQQRYFLAVRDEEESEDELDEEDEEEDELAEEDEEELDEAEDEELEEIEEEEEEQ